MDLNITESNISLSLSHSPAHTSLSFFLSIVLFLFSSSLLFHLLSFISTCTYVIKYIYTFSSDSLITGLYGWSFWHTYKTKLLFYMSHSIFYFSFFGLNTIESKETFWGLFILCYYIKLVNLGKFFQSYNSHFIAVFSTA